MIQQELLDIPSPCRQICQTNSKGYCIGCYRSREERHQWNQFSNEQRRMILRLCTARKVKEIKASRKKPQQKDLFQTEPDFFNSQEIMQQTILITGGAGFIGRHVAEYFSHNYPHYQCVILDKLTYAGHLDNLIGVLDADNVTFIQADINDYQTVDQIFQQYQFQGVIHLAAETHVDNSINAPLSFVETNITGTANLLEISRKHLSKYPSAPFKYLHISTDEVFGSINAPFTCDEYSRYQPSSPYSASKAAADHLIMAYCNTYQFPAIITYCTNNYGPFQHTEKLIPKTISRALAKNHIPIYGDGEQVRDWISVADHVRAIDLIFHQGKLAETYAISAQQEYSNLAIVHKICQYMEKVLKYPANSLTNLIKHVEDRWGHDFRYALNPSKIKQQLNWHAAYPFEEYLELTINWYLNHPQWLVT